MKEKTDIDYQARAKALQNIKNQNYPKIKQETPEIKNKTKGYLICGGAWIHVNNLDQIIEQAGIHEYVHAPYMIMHEHENTNFIYYLMKKLKQDMMYSGNFMDNLITLHKLECKLVFPIYQQIMYSNNQEIIDFKKQISQININQKMKNILGSLKINEFNEANQRLDQLVTNFRDKRIDMMLIE